MTRPQLPANSFEQSYLSERIIVYTSSGCPKCHLLKEWLKKHNLKFEERSLEDSDVMTELIIRNIFILSAPALEFKNKVYSEEDIFNMETVSDEKLLKILGINDEC